MRMSQAELEELKARNPVADIAGQYVKLRRAGSRLVGPCPICGGRATSQRFEVKTETSWACAVCSAGGDVISLVEKVEGCDFFGAIERLGGRRPVDNERARELLEAREEKRLQREKDAEKYREAERKRLFRTWKTRAAIDATLAHDYLATRGLLLHEACPGLGFLETAPYWHGEVVDARGRKSPRKIHEGPAMVAAFIRPDGFFGGLHFTYLAADGAGVVKLELADPETGELLNPKKMRGSKTGAHIAIGAIVERPRRLFVGEGIETVLSMSTALAHGGRVLEETAFWAAGDLGNLAGRATETLAHPTLKRPSGVAQRVPGPVPDPDDAGLNIPDSVEELILLGDGDSDSVLTDHAMTRAARRYARPGRVIRIVFAPAGLDFNDLLRDEGADRVLELLDAAPAFQEPDAAAIDAALRKFGLAELDVELATVRAAAGDEAKEILSGSAERLGQLVAAGALHDGFARAALEEAAAACGLLRDLGARAVKNTITSGLKRGGKSPRDVTAIRREAAEKSRPRPAADRTSPSSADADSAAAQSKSAAASSSVPAPAPPAGGGKSTTSSQTGGSPGRPTSGGAGRRPPAGLDDDTFNKRLAFFPLTDLGNAERFHERYKDLLLFCTALGWLAWDGRRWSLEGAEELVKIAEHETVRAIQKEAAAVRESGRKDVPDAPKGARDYLFDEKKGLCYSDKIASWGRSSEAANKLGALSKRGAPYFAVSIDKLDADKMKFNVANGTLTIARGADGDVISFGRHSPADLITKLSPVDYEPTAQCPTYDAFLAQMQPREEMRRFLHQWGGYSLTGDVGEQLLAFFYGKGGNGKSVLVDVWSEVAGDYGETVPIETFLEQNKQRSGGQATPDLAILPGKRMLRTSEPEKGAKLAEAMIKLVTGGEPIQARHLNRDFFKFYPQFKLTMSGNYRPTIAGTDEGIWRRVRLVPWTVSIPREKQDRHLIQKLRRELSGILNRLLDGLRDWCDNGLIEPEEVTKATAEYRSDSDPLGRFLAMCVQHDAGGRVQSSVLHAVYEAWCKSSGEKAWTNRGLSLAMKERGFVSAQSNVVWWHDIKLIKRADDFVDSHGHPVRYDNEGTTREPVKEDDEAF